MSEDPAHQPPSGRYYRATHGDWRGVLRFTITSWRRFGSCPMGWLDRIRVVSTALVPKLAGALSLETRIDHRPHAGEHGETHHALRLTKWGVVLFESREVFVLGADGRSLAVHGQQRLWPRMGAPRVFDAGRGEIDPTGDRARYCVPWLGTEMQVTTQARGSEVTVLMETPWSRGVQQLRRTPAPLVWAAPDERA